MSILSSTELTNKASFLRRSLESNIVPDGSTVPSCVVIGAKKAGTSSLAHFARPHSKLNVVAKEVHYFDQNLDKGI